MVAGSVLTHGDHAGSVRFLLAVGRGLMASLAHVGSLAEL